MLVFLLLFLCLFPLYVVSSGETSPRPGYCVMYDVCDPARELNCVNYMPAPVLHNSSLIESIKDVCDIDLRKYGNRSCISPKQWKYLSDGLNTAKLMLSSCPACWRNFKTLWCTLSVYPDQSLFVKITNQSEFKDSNNRKTQVVDEIDYYVTPRFRQNLFDSCINVSFGMTNSKVMEFMFSKGAAIDPVQLFNKMGTRSPFPIKFPVIEYPEHLPYDRFYPYRTFSSFLIPGPEWPQLDSIAPIDIPMLACDDPEYGCLCVDCHQSCPIPEDRNSWVQSPCLLLGGGATCWTVLVFATYTSLLMSCLLFMVWKKLVRGNLNAYVYPVDAEANHKTSNMYGALGTSYFYSLDSAISKYFYQHGLWIANNVALIISVLFIMIGIAIVLLVVSGGLKTEVDPAKLWVGPNSKSALEKTFYDDNFGPFSRISQVIVSKDDPEDPSYSLTMVNVDSITLLYDLMEKIRAIRVELESIFTLEDICLKPLGEECYVQSVNLLWPSKEYFLSSSTWRNRFSMCMTNPSECISSSTNYPIVPELVVGGVEEEEPYHAASSLVLTILLNNGRTDEENRVAILWEHQFINLLKQFEKDNPGYNFAYSSESSVECEIGRDAEANVPVVIISYLAMFLYVALALGRISSWKTFSRDSRITLAFGGVFIVAVSLLFSAAVYAALEIKVTLIIAEVIPFLVLAVGVDNLFLLVQAYDASDPRLEVSHRVAETYSKAGPSILVTELAELLAFGAGGMVGMPAVASFSLFASLAILFDIIMQLTTFAAFLTLDGMRKAEGRSDPILRIIDSIFCGSFGFKEKHIPDSNQGERFLESFVKMHVAPRLARSRRVQRYVYLGFSLLVMFSLIGLGKIKLGLDQRLAVPSDSYLIKYYDAVEDELLVGPPVFFVVRNVNMIDVEIQQLLASRFYRDIKNTSIGSLFQANRGSPGTFIASPLSNWVDDFLAWGRQCCLWNPATCRFCESDFSDCVQCISDDVYRLEDIDWGHDASRKFRTILSQFLYKAYPTIECPLGGAAAYASQVALSPLEWEHGPVIASSFKTFLQPLRSQDDFIQSLRSSRRMASILENDEPKLDIFAYSPYFIFFDQYLTIIPTSIILAAVLLLAIFIVSWILFGCFSAAILVAAAVGTTALCLLGTMGWWGITLSAVSLVNVVIAMGISVEFSANIVRAYMVVPGDKSSRVIAVLSETGVSVFSGITMTKLIGILILYFSKSKIFEVFYFRMYLATVALAVFIGLVVLPVTLSICGPKYYLKPFEADAT